MGNWAPWRWSHSFKSTHPEGRPGPGPQGFILSPSLPSSPYSQPLIITYYLTYLFDKCNNQTFSFSERKRKFPIQCSVRESHLLFLDGRFLLLCLCWFQIYLSQNQHSPYECDWQPPGERGREVRSQRQKAIWDAGCSCLSRRPKSFCKRGPPCVIPPLLCRPNKTNKHCLCWVGGAVPGSHRLWAPQTMEEMTGPPHLHS